jgi:hypothetical protein
MRTYHKVLLGGAAAALLAGSAALAASKPVVHHLSVLVPGYGVERIDYTGKAAPRVVLLPGADAWDSAAFASPFAAPFGDFDRIAAQMDAMSAQMDRQMAASLAQFRQLQAAPNGVYRAGLTSLPPGTQSYSVVTTIVGNNVCTRSVRISSGGDGAKPQTISNSSGNCGDAAPSGQGATIRASTHTAPPVDARHSI